MYACVEYDNHPEAMKYCWYFCFRRLAFGIFIVFLQDCVVLQVLLLTNLSLLMTSWAVAIKPMLNFLNDIVFIANEMILLLCCYFILVFTEYVPTFEDRYTFGYIYLAFFGITTIFNFALLIIILITDIYEAIKRIKLKKLGREMKTLRDMKLPKNVALRKQKSANNKLLQSQQVSKLVGEQISRKGKKGNWNSVMPNGDIVHFSKLNDYNKWSKHDTKLKKDIYDQLGMVVG